MHIVKALIDGCFQILTIEIRLFNFTITLWGVLLFVLIGSLVLRFFYRLFQ